jgi:hypothetical protein
VLYNVIYAVIIIFFTYFYTAVVLNPNDLAENMRKYGGFIPGIRPGRKTAEYIDRVLSRITLPGAVFLALIAVLPDSDRARRDAVPGLRRHQRADRGGRGAGHAAADRVAPASCGTTRASSSAVAFVAARGCSVRLVLLGPPGVGKGTQGGGSPRIRLGADLDRRDAERRGRPAHAARGSRRGDRWTTAADATT